MTVTSKMHFTKTRGGRKRIERGAAPAAPERVPHVARLMALAIHLDQLLREGKVKDCAEIARLGHVSRARVTQIMNMLSLAPDIQEQILCDSAPMGANLTERDVRPLTAIADWLGQRRRWHTRGAARDSCLRPARIRCAAIVGTIRSLTSTMNDPADQIRAQLDRLVAQASALNLNLARTFEPERRLRMQNELASAKQDIARLRRELRSLPKRPADG